MNQVRKLQNQYLHNNTGDGTLPQAIHGGTRRLELVQLKIIFKVIFFLLQLVSLQSMAIHCNRPGVQTTTPHTSFSPAQCTISMMYNHTTWLKTSHWMCPCSAHSYHPHTIHDERLIVSRCFSVSRFVPFRVSPSPCTSLSTSTCTLS